MSAPHYRRPAEKFKPVDRPMHARSRGRGSAFFGCRDGLGAGQNVGRLGVYFRQRTLQLDFQRAVHLDFAQKDGSPTRHLDVADVHSFKDDRKPDCGQEDNFPGPKFPLPGDLGDVKRGGRNDGGGRRRGGGIRGMGYGGFCCGMSGGQGAC